MAIPKHISAGFDTMLRAYKNGDLAVLECTDKQNKPAYLVVATQRERDGVVSLIPFAQMIEGNPFDQFNPPTLFDAPAQPDPAATPAGNPTDDSQRASGGARADDDQEHQPLAG